MAKYTIELNTLMADDLFNLFDFEYNFYSDEARPNFEQLFKDCFRFREIGFETVPRFKHELKSKLNLIMPYYSQLYETEVKAKDINFLLNKDLKERFTREIVGNEKGTSNTTYSGSNENTSSSTYSSTNENTSSTSANSESLSKESYLDNGNADLSLTDGLTGVSNNNSNGTSSSSSSTNDTNSTSSSSLTNDSNTSSNNTSSDNTMSETTELISQGNIGITSSAELLQKWRDTIININQLIISECDDLFMQIY